MNQIEIFNSPEFGSIRIVEENGKYLFCGADVAKSLGYKDTVNALKTHCREDGVAFYHLTDNLGREQKAKFISEGNLYRLIVHSNCHQQNDLSNGSLTRFFLPFASMGPISQKKSYGK